MYTAAILIILLVFGVWVLDHVTRGSMARAPAAPPCAPPPTSAPSKCGPSSMATAGLLAVERPLAAVPQGGALEAAVADVPDVDATRPIINLGVGIHDGTPITNLDPGVTPQDNLCPPEQPAPCANDLQWQNTLPGCGTFHVPAKNGLPRSYITDSRVWQGDLNPLIQERAALLAKQWDPYEHMRSRQAWMQFLATNFSARSDRHMRPISSLEQAGQPLNNFATAANPGVPGWCAMNEVTPTA